MHLRCRCKQRTRAAALKDPLRVEGGRLEAEVRDKVLPFDLLGAAESNAHAAQRSIPEYPHLHRTHCWVTQRHALQTDEPMCDMALWQDVREDSLCSATFRVDPLGHLD